MQKTTFADPITGLVSNIMVIAVGVYAWLILSIDADLYYLAVQEDEYLEWASFWAFAAASVVFLHRALRPALELRHAWFVLGLASFCFFVAMEEISWGQRVIGYRPPEYFLASNYQQEVNLQNVIEVQLRGLAVRVVIFGYGVALRDHSVPVQ